MPGLEPGLRFACAIFALQWTAGAAAQTHVLQPAVGLHSVSARDDLLELTAPLFRGEVGS